MQCCGVDDTSPENTIVAFLQAEWIPMFADCTSASILLSHGTRAPSRSLGGRNDALAARWWSCLESEPATWSKKRSVLVLMVLETGGQPVLSVTEALVTCPVYGIWMIFSDRPCVKGIQSPSKSLCDCARKLPIQTTPWGHRLIQPDLYVDPDMWLPNILLQQSHTIPDNTNAPENLGLTTTVVSGACSQVCEFIDHLYLAGTDMDHLWN